MTSDSRSWCRPHHPLHCLVEDALWTRLPSSDPLCVRALLQQASGAPALWWPSWGTTGQQPVYTPEICDGAFFFGREIYWVGLQKYCKVYANQLPDDWKTHAASSACAFTLGDGVETMGRGRTFTRGELGWELTLGSQGRGRNHCLNPATRPFGDTRVRIQSFWLAFLARLARVCPLVVGVLPDDSVLSATRNDIWPFGWIITNILHPEGIVSHLGTLCLTCKRLA
jgi:hypothetical protein